MTEKRYEEGVDNQEKLVVPLMNQTAGKSPHKCPVCGRTYVPDKQSISVPGEGPLLMSMGDLCLKAGDGWARAYYHDREVVIADGE